MKILSSVKNDNKQIIYICQQTKPQLQQRVAMCSVTGDTTLQRGKTMVESVHHCGRPVRIVKTKMVL